MEGRATIHRARPQQPSQAPTVPSPVMAARASSSTGQRFAFPSPGRVPTNGPAFVDAVQHIKQTMHRCDPAVLRQAVREEWEITLIGSEYHCSFLANTLFHRAPTATLSRSVESHGQRMVKHTASQIANHLTAEDLDMVAPILLPKLSAGFLDKALALRLESIQAQQLVNALGRAERLGYDVRDVVSGNPTATSRQERVIPTANPIPTPPPHLMARASQPQYAQQQTVPIFPNVPSPEAIVKMGIIFCERCNRPCGGQMALMSHRKSSRCGSLPPPVGKLGKEHCLFCGQYFVGGNGLRDHIANRVCGHYSQEVRSSLLLLFLDAEEQHKKIMTKRRDSQSQTSPSTSAQSPRDPYAGLEPDTRRQFDDEMFLAEKHYSLQMVTALEMEQSAQKAEIIRVKNALNNKQSMIRKRYGVKLRERRSRADMEEERSRMTGSSGRTTPAPTSTGKRAHSEVDGTPGSASTGRKSLSRHGTPPKRVLITELSGDGWARSAGTAEPQSAASTSASTSPTTAPQTAPGAATPAASAASGSATKPMPMSIAGSYTNPVRARNVPQDGNKSAGAGGTTAPIEIADEESEQDSHTDADMEDVDD